MSNYHIIDGDFEGAGTAYTIVFHIPVPDETNLANINIRVALSQDNEISKESKVPWLNQAHKDELTNGEVYERIRAYRRDPGNTLPEDRNAIDAEYLAMVPIVQDKLRDRYKFWGYERDVP